MNKARFIKSGKIIKAGKGADVFVRIGIAKYEEDDITKAPKTPKKKVVKKPVKRRKIKKRKK